MTQKMDSLKQYKKKSKLLPFFALILLGLSRAIVGAPDCEAGQFYITYGDKYSNFNPKSTHMLTIGLVVNSNNQPGSPACDPGSTILELTPKDSTKPKIQLKPTKTTPYTYKEPQLKLNYTRTSVFFYLNQKTLSKAPKNLQYQITLKNQTYGPFSYLRKPLQPSAEETQAINIFWIADMDISNISTHTQSRLNKTDWSQYDCMVQTGDFAYDIVDDNGLRGDNYFKNLETPLTRTTFLQTPGNHENYDAARMLNYRFRMPLSFMDNGTWAVDSSNYYTVILGPVQLFFISYDFIFEIYPTRWKTYLAAMEADLKKSSLNEDVKWRVVMTHRPIYCSDSATIDCFINPITIRPFEALYNKYKVDFHLNGHEHFYERLKFIDGFQLYSPTTRTSKDGVEMVKHAGKPVYIINGCAGNEEYWPATVDTENLNVKVVADKECYSTLEIDSERFWMRLFDSETNDVLDSVQYFRTNLPPSNNPGLVYDVIIGCMVVLLLFVILILFLVLRRKRAGRGQGPSLRETGYGFVGSQETKEAKGEVVVEEEDDVVQEIVEGEEKKFEVEVKVE